MSVSAEELRALFDAEFALPYAAQGREPIGVLLLAIGDVPYALPLSAISAIHTDPRLGRVPSRQRSFLGLATIRNTIVPIYDLAVALGHRKQPAPAHWIVVSRGEAPIGWAFDTLDGHLRIEPPESGTIATSLDVAGITRRVIDLEELRHAA